MLLWEMQQSMKQAETFLYKLKMFFSLYFRFKKAIYVSKWDGQAQQKPQKKIEEKR